MGARLYSPATGRFLQVDPVYGGSCNAYDYTCQNPVNGSDLTGTDDVEQQDFGGGEFDDPLGFEELEDWLAESQAEETEGEVNALVDEGASRTQAARLIGQQGEGLAGITDDKTQIPSLTGTANYRVPDGLTDTTLTEVKNVKYLYLSSQLKDFYLFSQGEGISFDLIVRSSTVLSPQLQGLVDSGAITLLRTLP